jgi:hypothetical protein
MPIDFCTFSLVWDNSQDSWKLRFSGIESTDIEGINLMLGGATVEEYLTEEEFIQNIRHSAIPSAKTIMR